MTHHSPRPARQRPPHTADPLADSNAEQANRLLARTINLGLNLGAPAEASWTVQLGSADLNRCAQAGFTAVRLVVSLAQHCSPTDPVQFEPVVLDRINHVIEGASERGLAVVVANAIDPELMSDPAGQRDRLIAFARQLAAGLSHHGPAVILEPLSEPQGALDPLWNDYLPGLIGAVREADTQRTVVIGPRSYNNARFLGELTLPDDEQNLVVTIHHYWPIRFTMQGEAWLGSTEVGDPADWLGTTWDGTPEQQAELEAGFDAVASYARARQRPVFVGEFGTTNNADIASRVRWTRFNRELAERHGLSWGCWSYAPSFSIYDTTRSRWHHDLLDALIPPATYHASTR